MPRGNSVTMLVTYVPKPGKDEDLLRLVRQHWPTLRRLDLVTATPGRVWRGTDKRSGRSSYIEMFEWKEETSSDTAHQTPEVMAVWESMGPILEDMNLTRLEQV
jgi:hypothetical protein